MLKKLFQSFRSPLRRAAHKRSTPEVLNSNQHPLRRAEISRYALSVVDRLQQAGYQAYLVGGCVRDLLLNLEPKDFDVATSATPEQVRAEFRNARVIGRRFKLVHVHFGREIIEVATFRANHPQGDEDEDSNLSSRNESGRILRDNLKRMGRDERWLQKQVQQRGAQCIADVYLLMMNDAGQVYFAAKELG